MKRLWYGSNDGEVSVLRALWLDCKFIYASLYVKVSQILASMRADSL